jgi:hypothetical protein
MEQYKLVVSGEDVTLRNYIVYLMMFDIFKRIKINRL